MTMVWGDEAPVSPACEAEEHGACPMWSPPGAGPPRLCKCGCHRRTSILETKVGTDGATATGAVAVPGADPGTDILARQHVRSIRRLQLMGGLQVAAGAIGVVGDAKAFGVLLLATGGAALAVASRRQRSA